MVLERIRRQADRLGIRNTKHMNRDDLIRAIQTAEGREPCFDQPHCRASLHCRCDWRHACRAEPEPTRGLILSANVIIGRQIVMKLSSEYGWDMTFVRQDRQAYALIQNGNIDVVIADLNSVDIGGMAVLTYVRHHWPSIMTYAIARNDDPFLKKLARDMGGCLGFFHRVKGQIELDTRSGITVPPSPPGPGADASGPALPSFR